MDYTPRYAQPFTLSQAIQLDVATITDEIARLQQSLELLKRTQDELREFIISGSEDHDIMHAIEDNTVTIGSQEERVGMLEMALTHKGVSVNSAHYAVTPVPDPFVAPPAPPGGSTSRNAFSTNNGLGDDETTVPSVASSDTFATINGVNNSDPGNGDDGGVYL